MPGTKSPNSKRTDEVIESIRQVYDPEIPVNVYDLGLIYRVEEVREGEFKVDMTLTSPNCPVAESLPVWVRDATLMVEGVRKAAVEVVWDPPWDPEKMSEAAKLELGMI